VLRCGDVRALPAEPTYDAIISGLPFNNFTSAEVRGFLEHFRAMLKPGGILSVWSAGDNEAFTLQLRQCGFQTEKKTVRARHSQKGSRHILWLAQKPEPVLSSRP